MTGSRVTCTVVVLVKKGFVNHQLLMSSVLHLDTPNNDCLFTVINRKKSCLPNCRSPISCMFLKDMSPIHGLKGVYDSAVYIHTINIYTV